MANDQPAPAQALSNPLPLPAPNPVTELEFKQAVIQAVLWPTLLMLFIAGVLIWQVNHLIITMAAVEHIDHIIAQAHLLEKDSIDMETGLRGYLLTGEKSFLQPYDAGFKDFQTNDQALAALTANDPDQLLALTQISKQQMAWLVYARDQIATRAAGGDYASVIRAGQGKELVDAMRALFIRYVFNAQEIRDRRVLASRQAGKVAFALSAVFLAAGIAVIIVATHRRSARLAQSYGKLLEQTQQLNKHLEDRVEERTRQLQEANAELEAFSYSVSHDLRAPLRHIAGFVEFIQKADVSSLNAESQENLNTVALTARRAGKMVDALLALSRLGRQQMHNSDVDMDALLREVMQELAPEIRQRLIDWRIAPLPHAWGDPVMLKIALHNLLANAVKYTSKRSQAVIEVGSQPQPDATVYFVRDNGAGFDPRYADKLFGVFQRLHREDEFEGTGIGLADVRRIIFRHGGRVWAEATLDRGATFFLSLPRLPGNHVNDERHP